MTKALFLIDPQNDFCSPKGALAVTGAPEDCKRTADLIDHIDFDDIFVSLDSHNRWDISHASYWHDAMNKHPEPFTIIEMLDVVIGDWRTSGSVEVYHEGRRKHPTSVAIEYLKELKRNNKYPHIIWPDHCIVGTWGHCIDPEIERALSEWSIRNGREVNYIFKGLDPDTEHFSAMGPEVPNGNTEMDSNLFVNLRRFDEVLIAGQASSHCVKSTVEDLVYRKEYQRPTGSTLNNVVYLDDACSPVGTFEDAAKVFVNDISRLDNVTITTTVKYIKENK